MSNTETFYNELHAYVQQVANQIVDLSGGNSVVTGVVTQALGTYYTVKLTEGDSGSSVKAVTVNNNLNLSVNESVYLIKANGTLDSAYYILGRVESIQEAFLNLTLAERFQNETEIDATYRLNSLIQDEAVLETLRAKGAFQIGGTFTCSKANTEDYGIRVHLYCGNTLIKTYELNTHYFIGQPFRMMSMPQSRTVQLDETTLKSGFDAIKIETFGQDFTYNEVKLSVGFLLNVDGLISVDVTVINDKDYFSKHNSELANNVHLKAGVTYEGQDFSANSLQYYWMIKDDTVTSTHEQYLEFVGEGWKCLNSYSNVSALGLDKPLQLWNCRTNEIILNDSEQCPQFINTLKCVIKYQQLVTESEEFTIYNYNKESFSAKIEASASPALLILKTDSLVLNCLVENANEEIDIKDYAYKYQWYDSKGLIEGATQSSLNIITGEGFNEDTNSYGMLAEDIELTETFYCVVRTYQSNEDATLDNVLSVETSNFFQVISKVAISAELKSPTYYKYYISNSPYCTFEKAPTSEDDLNWNGDWVIRDPANPTATWVVDDLLAGWDYENETPIDGHQDSAAYNYINNIFLKNGQYIYLTKKMLWHEEKLGRYTFLREENWSSPLITKGKTENGNDIVNAALEKLNTFNQLTEGGLQKGLLYNEENGDLYINADFINTGALTVADNAGKRIFYADVDQQQVEAGGFTVDNTSIRGMAVGISSNIRQGDDPTPTPDAETGEVEELDGAIAFWAGATYEDRADAPFKVTHNGVLYATGVKITELNQEVADRIAAMTETNQAIAAEKSAREQAIEDTKALINSSVADLQNQLDGEITTWFYEGAPTLENEPAINWVSNEETMEKHIGDLYYDTETQYCYRWARAKDNESYGWEQIADTGIVEAMAAASEAKGIADSKRQIFHRAKFDALADVPDNYDINDMIVVGQLASSSGTTASTQFYICTAVPGKGESKSLNHWTLATDIATRAELSSQVSGLAATMEQNVSSLQSQVDGKIDTWFNTAAPRPSSASDSVTNAPASDWDTVAKKDYHLDDLYYNNSTGYCYRWIKNSNSKYYWTRIKDRDITSAATAASNAQATADGKITTHYRATAPAAGTFAEGDLWIPGESDGNANKTQVAVTQNGSLVWVPLDDAATSKEVADVDSKLTKKIEDTATTLTTNYTNLVTNLETELTKSLYFEATKLKDESNKEIPAIIMKAKNADNAGMMYFDTDQLVIKSDHLMLNHNGSKYKDGYFTIDTDNFKIDGSGNVTVTGTINATSLNIGATQQSFDSIQQEINKNIKTATDTANSASRTANSASSVATGAADVAEGAQQTATAANATATAANATAEEASETASKANATAVGANATATVAYGMADEAKGTAENAQKYAENVSATVTALSNATLPSTYLGVNTTNDWIYIKSKTENAASPGKIFFDTNALVINSDHLKLNHNGNGYSAGNLIINTDNLKVNVNGDNAVSVKGALEATSLTISQDVAKDAGLGSQVSDNLFFDSAKEVVNQYSATGPEFVQSAYNLSPIFKKYGLVPYTLSFDLQAPVAGSVQVYCQNGNGSEYSFSKIVVVESINTWKRYKVTFTPYKADQSTYTSSLLAFYGEYNTGRVPRIRNIKLELGDTGLLVPPWSPAIEESAVPNENLATIDKLTVYTGSNTTVAHSFSDYKYFLDLGSAYNGLGAKISASIFEPSTDYVLSFKYREVNQDRVPTGQIKIPTLGGHAPATWFVPNKIVYISNGVQYFATNINWPGPSYLPAHLAGDISVRMYFSTTSSVPTESDLNLYIQPGRGSTGESYATNLYCEIWDVKIEKGTMATNWVADKKEIASETFFNVDPSTGVITLQAANSLSLTGDKFEITSGKFKVSTEGKVTATDMHVSQGTIADWSITPELQVYGTVHFHETLSGTSSPTVTKWNSLYTGGISSANLYALSTNGLQVEYLDRDSDNQRQVISFTWPQLAKTLLKCVGIKSGQVVIPKGSTEWVFAHAFTTTYGSYYRVICSPSEHFSSANIMTASYYENATNGNTVYYVGRKRDSGNDFPTTINWIAIPLSVFGFHYDSTDSYSNMKILK